MARFHATGAVSDPSKIGPCTEDRVKILVDLKGEGVVKHAYRRSQGPDVFLLVNAAASRTSSGDWAVSLHSARALLTFDFKPVNKM